MTQHIETGNNRAYGRWLEYVIQWYDKIDDVLCVHMCMGLISCNRLLQAAVFARLKLQLPFTSEIQVLSVLNIDETCIHELENAHP